jgi:hypothetical protein
MMTSTTLIYTIAKGLPDPLKLRENSMRVVNGDQIVYWTFPPTGVNPVRHN